MRCLECAAEVADPTRPCARCGAPVLVGSQQADMTAVADSPPPPPLVRQPPIRRAAAITGSVLALLAGVVGLVSDWLFYPVSSPWANTCTFAADVVPTVVAVAALRRIDRPFIAGLLQGVWLPAVTFAIEDLVGSTAGHMLGNTGRYLAGYRVGIASDVLGAAAAVVLLVAWSPAFGWRRARRLRPLPVVMLCGVGLSQIALLIAFIANHQNAPFESTFITYGIAGILVGLAVTWYAVSIPACAFGGALVLGWSIVQALWLLAGLGSWAAVPRLILLVAVMILALFHANEKTQVTSPTF